MAGAIVVWLVTPVLGLCEAARSAEERKFEF